MCIRDRGMGSSAYIPLGTETVIAPSMDWAGLYLRVSIKARSIFGEEYDSDAVSYTHLDVYKRQDLPLFVKRGTL